MTDQGPAPGQAAGTGGEAAGSPPQPGNRAGQLGKTIIDSVVQGSPAVVTFLAIVAALALGALLIAFTDTTVLHAWGRLLAAPGNAIGQAWDAISAAYSALFDGAIFSPSTVAAAFHGGSVAAIFYPISQTMSDATPLILTGLSVAIAFRAGLFNIGAAGQWIGGAMVATYLGFGVSMPPVIHVIVCLIGGIAGGAVIGWLGGELKARTGAHEVIVTIMLNYVMYNLLSYLLGTPRALQAPGQSNLISPNVAANAQLPHVGGPPPQVDTGFRSEQPPVLPARHPESAAGARSVQPDQPERRGQRPAAARGRPAAAGRHRLPGRAGGGRRGRVAADPQHHRFSVPDRGRQPERGAQRRNERRAGVGAGHGDCRRPGRAERGLGDPGQRRPRPHLQQLRHLRFRRHHRRPARAGQARRSGARRATVRSPALRRHRDAGSHLGPDRHRHGARGAHRAVRRRPAADPGGVPAARGAGRRPRGGREGVERMTALATTAGAPVTVNRRIVVAGAFIGFGLIDILVFGLFAHKGDATFALSLPTASVQVPSIHAPAALVAYVLGAASIAIGIWRAANDVKLRDRLAVAGSGGAPDFFQRHGVGAGGILLAAEGAQAAGRHANIGVVDVAGHVEVGDGTVHPLANVVRQPTDCQDVTRAIERKRVVSRQTLMSHHLVVNWHQARVVGLERVELLGGGCVLRYGGHRFNHIPGKPWNHSRSLFQYKMSLKEEAVSNTR